MTSLSEKETALIDSVIVRHPEVTRVKLFGSRAKGCHTPSSDIDLALWGVEALQAESIAAELEELPLPYRFDVKAFESIKQNSLREHIQRRGIDWASPRASLTKSTMDFG
jgi:predicted nucleotidyltransferase